MFLRAHSVLLWLLSQVIQLDPEADEFKCTTVIQHAYPPTQLQWSPPGVARESGDVLATIGDYLRLWKVPTELREAETISRPEHLFDSVRCDCINCPKLVRRWLITFLSEVFMQSVCMFVFRTKQKTRARLLQICTGIPCRRISSASPALIPSQPSGT